MSNPYLCLRALRLYASNRLLVCGFVVCSTLGLFTACSNNDALDEMSLEDQIQTGINALRIFDFDLAYEILSAAQPRTSNLSKDWGIVTYSLGLAAWHKAPPSPEGVAEAERMFEAVVAHEPDSLYAASALLDLGRMAEISDYLGEPTDVASAQEYYRRVRKEFPNSDMSARATVFLAQSMVQGFEEEEIRAALELLEEEISAQPQSQWVGTMAQYQAQLYAYYLGDYEAALEPYSMAMDVGFPRSAASDASLWQFGLIAEASGNYLMAVHVLSRLVENYPRSIYGTVARERVIRIAKAHPGADITIPELPDMGHGL